MNYEQILLVGGKEFGDREYEIEDSEGFVNMADEDLALPKGFYGGRVANLAKTDRDGIYLIVSRNNIVMDILVNKDEVVDLTVNELKQLMRHKGLKVPPKATKAELLSLLHIDMDAGDDPADAYRQSE